MTASAEVVKIALLALVTGAVLPLLVQLFLTLRAMRLAAERVETRLDKILDDVSELADGVKARAAAPSALGSTLAAAVPAVLAAVQAFRTSFHHPPDPTASGEGHVDSATREHGQAKERSHEQ